MKYTKNKQILTFFALIIISLGTGFIAPSLHAVDDPVAANQAQLDMPLLNNSHLLNAMLQNAGQGIERNQFLAFLNQNHDHPLATALHRAVGALRGAIGGIPPLEVNRWRNWQGGDRRGLNEANWNAIEAAIGAVVTHMQDPNADTEEGEIKDEGQNENQDEIQLFDEPWSCPGVQMNQGEYDQPEYNQPYRGPRGKASQKDHFEKLHNLMLQYWDALGDFKANKRELKDDPNWVDTFCMHEFLVVLVELLAEINSSCDKESDEFKRLVHAVFFGIGCIRYDWWNMIGETPNRVTTPELISLLIDQRNEIFGIISMDILLCDLARNARECRHKILAHKSRHRM
jgi:hypothetical protein